MKNIWKLLGGLGGLLLFIGLLISSIVYVYQIIEYGMAITYFEVMNILANIFSLLGCLLVTIGFFTAKASRN